MCKQDYFLQTQDQSSIEIEEFKKNKANLISNCGSKKFLEQELQDQPMNQNNDLLVTKSQTDIKEENESKRLMLQFEIISKNNIGKNVIKAFFSYILNTKSNDLLASFVAQSQNEIEQARKIASKYFKAYQFNNRSLLKLIQHKKYGKAFEFYLTFEAENWLSQSKVKNKEEHLIYIDFLKLCCSNSSFKEWIVFYKKMKPQKFNDRIQKAETENQ